MQPSTEILAQAVAALRTGDVASARALLEPLTQRGDADAWALLASIERRGGDAQAERAALVAALRGAPRHLGALLARGDCERRAGDDRAAVRFLRTALAVARANPTPPQFHPALQQAQAFVGEASARFADMMTAALDDAGLTGASVPPRVGEAIDLLLGHRELFLQQPSMLYFPGLVQRAWFDRADFAWASAVEAQTAAITDELLALLANGEPFEPYVRDNPASPAPANHLLNDPGWGAVHLMEDGRPHRDHAPRCPAAMAALALAPQPAIGSRSPMALFSRLRPGTHIAAHHGVLNTRLICHLPLIVPDGCSLRVGAETRTWRQGELTIFDDSFEHEAWNRGVSDRVVLLFEIWRPDIGAGERAAITTLLEAAEAHGLHVDPD